MPRHRLWRVLLSCSQLLENSVLAASILALLCAAIPIFAGYVLCTIGLLGLIFIVGDYTRAPNQIEQIDTRLVCRVTLWGSAATDSGYTVHLYRSWAWLPLIERSVLSMSVNQTDQSKGPPMDVTCADALKKYLGSQRP